MYRSGEDGDPGPFPALPPLHSLERCNDPPPAYPVFLINDDAKFTPTKHRTPPPHHSSRPAAAHTDTETPLLHHKER